MLPVEVLDQLRDGEDLLIAVRPPQAREIVEQRAGKVSIVAVLQDADGAMPLGEPLLVGAEDHRQVRELGDRVPQSLVHEDLPRRVHHVIVAARHQRDLHLHVVHHGAEVVERHAVRAQNHLVVQLLVLRGDLALDQVLEGGRSIVGHAEPDHRSRRSPRQVLVAAGARVLEPTLLACGLLAQTVQLFLGAVAAVRLALRDQGFRVPVVRRESLHLEVGTVRPSGDRPLVPIEP